MCVRVVSSEAFYVRVFNLNRTGRTAGRGTRARTQPGVLCAAGHSALVRVRSRLAEMVPSDTGDTMNFAAASGASDSAGRRGHNEPIDIMPTRRRAAQARPARCRSARMATRTQHEWSQTSLTCSPGCRRRDQSPQRPAEALLPSRRPRCAAGRGPAILLRRRRRRLAKALGGHGLRGFEKQEY